MKKQIVLISLTVFAVTCTRATVKPIHDGENMWKLVERIGIEADAIENKVCNMPSDERCYYEIRQTDIPYTITEPGVYCLAENVTVPADVTGITIESDCVVLDLKGRSIDGQGLDFNVGITVDGSAAGLSGKPANVVVKNGVVKRTDDDGVSVVDVTGPVKLSNLRATGMTSWFAGFDIWLSTGVLVENCEASENDFDGFQILDSFYCVLRDCIARKNSSDGFFITSSDHCCLIDCKAYENGAWFEDTGFYASWSNSCFFHRCIAWNSISSDGFLIQGNNNLVNECISVANENGSGFLSYGNNNIFRRCIACGNDYDGFFIDGNSSNNQILNCSAVGNGDDGIGSYNASSKIFANAANDNATDYEGVGLLVKTTPTASNKYWTNVERI